MKIGVDCRLSGIRHAGIGRYILNLILRLPALAPETEWVFWFNEQSQADEVPDAPNVQKCVVTVPHYGLREQFEMPRHFAAAQVDVLHVPHFNVPLFYSGKLVVTIHDLLWHHQRGTQVTTLPSWQYWLKYVAYRLVARHAITQASTILVPAATVQREIATYYPDQVNKVIVTKEGATALLDSPVSVNRSTHHTLLYIGSLYPHKNIAVVLEALKQSRSLQLIVIGSRSVFQSAVQDQANRLGVASQIEWAGYVSDEKLEPYLKKATALVQPSLSEGFGLTGIEAMASGLPVVASDLAIFREVYGSAAVFFDPENANSLVMALAELTLEKREQLRKDGLRWVAQYSWDNMAKQTLAAYQRV